MKKEPLADLDDDLPPECDMKDLLKQAGPNVYYDEYRQGTNIILLDDDVSDAFPTPEAVNEALRLVMKLSVLPVRAPVQVREE